MYFSYHRYHHGCLDTDYNFLPFQVSVCKLILTTSTCHRQHSWKSKRFSSICSCKCILFLYCISSRRCHLCLCSLKQGGGGAAGWPALKYDVPVPLFLILDFFLPIFTKHTSKFILNNIFKQIKLWLQLSRTSCINRVACILHISEHLCSYQELLGSEINILINVRKLNLYKLFNDSSYLYNAFIR